MIEIIWHGRGGQGAFTAAKLLGAACSLDEGRCSLAFPSFGPERRGAPMRAYTKIDNAPIGNRSAVAQADFAVYLDDTLFSAGWDKELKPDGVALVNSTRSFGNPRVAAIDASGISAAVLGRALPNTALLGALSALCDQVDAENLREAVRQCMPERLHEKNLRVIETARGRMAAAMQAPRAQAASDAESAAGGAPSAAAGKDGAATQSELERRPCRIPTLRASLPAVADYAHATCFEAGHLVTVNAGWRNERPVIDPSRCTGCLQCYLHCPDGAVYKPAPAASAASSDGAQQPIAIDLAFCKGCGICVRLCRAKALSLIPESEARAADAARNAATRKEADAL